MVNARPMSVVENHSGVKKKGRSPRCGESTDNRWRCDTVKSPLLETSGPLDEG